VREASRLAALVTAVVAVASLGSACSSPTDGGSHGGGTAAGAPPTDVAPTTTAMASSAASYCGAEPEAIGSVASTDLVETSGIVASRRQAGLVWGHGDSGSGPELFALGLDGTDRGRVRLVDVEPFDWEDVAVLAGVGDGPDRLVVGDIGDNFGRSRDDSTPLQLHVIEEPSAPGAGGVVTAPVLTVAVSYPDGPHDAEAVVADPLTGDFFVLTKEWGGGTAGLYRVPDDAVDGSAPDPPVTMSREGAVGGTDGALVTGADNSPDGTLVAVRTYRDVLLWDRDPARSVPETLAEAPTCSVTVLEPQGEAVAVLVDGSGIVTVSEGAGAVVNRLGRS
jgi:hypothetical protein